MVVCSKTDMNLKRGGMAGRKTFDTDSGPHL